MLDKNQDTWIYKRRRNGIDLNSLKGNQFTTKNTSSKQYPFGLALARLVKFIRNLFVDKIAHICIEYRQ